MATNCGCCRAEPVIIRGGPCGVLGPASTAPVFFPVCDPPEGGLWSPGIGATCSPLGPYPPDYQITMIASLPYIYNGSGAFFYDSLDPRIAVPGNLLRLNYTGGCLYRSPATSQEVYENGPGPFPSGWPHGSGALLGTTVYYYELDFSSGIGAGQATLKRVTLSHPTSGFPSLVTWKNVDSLETSSRFKIVNTGANETLYSWKTTYVPPLLQRTGEYPCNWSLFGGNSNPVSWCFQIDAKIRGVDYTFFLDPSTAEVFDEGYTGAAGRVFWPGYWYGGGHPIPDLSLGGGLVANRVAINVGWSWDCDGVSMSVNLWAGGDGWGGIGGGYEAAYSGPVGYRWFESSSGALPAAGFPVPPGAPDPLNESGDTATVTIVSCGSGSGSGSGGGGGLTDEECWDLAESLDDLIESFMASQGMEPCEVEYDPDDYNTIIAQVICSQIQSFQSQCAGTEAYDWFVDKWGVP